MTEEIHLSSNSRDGDGAEIVGILELVFRFGYPPGREPTLRMTVDHPLGSKTAHGGVRCRNRVDDIVCLRNLVDILVRTVGTESMVVGGHHREPRGDHGHQALGSVVHVLHGRWRAQAGNAAGAVRPGNHGPALRRRHPGRDQHHARGRDVVPGCVQRVIENPHRPGALRQGITGEGFLTQEIARLARG
jgi:hypothetical protein